MIDYNDCNDYQSLRVYPDKGSCVTGLFISKHLRSSLIIIEMSAMCVFNFTWNINDHNESFARIIHEYCKGNILVLKIQFISNWFSH